MSSPFDVPDLFYLLLGLAFLGLTFQPAFKRSIWFNLPFFYVALGALIVLALPLPVIDPLGPELATKVIQHASELIVIISLAGAGLAIDLREGWRRWEPTWRLLAIAMPLTIMALAWMGWSWLGMSVASAVLLAASLAPTDPVLARSVQVGPPGEREEPTRVGLTAEAGLNDGLAFPFVWAAITLAGLSVAEQSSLDWLWSWFGFDLLYRVAAGIGIGWLTGWIFVHVIHSDLGDGEHVENPALTVLAATFVSYGVAEAVDGYGFLAVFVAARVGRALTRGTDADPYNREAHDAADQLESILLAVLLLWLGMFVGSGVWMEWSWKVWLFALAFLLLVRPLAGLVALIGYGCSRHDRVRLSFFGVRGMGSIFYIAYGQTHADFADIDTVWHAATLVIVCSLVIHGFSARLFMPEGEATDDAEPEKMPQGQQATKVDGRR